WMCDLRGFGPPSPHYGEHRRRAAASRQAFGGLRDRLERAARRCPTPEATERVAAERAALEITCVELELLELRLAVAERATVDPAATWSEAERARCGQARQRQWDLAAQVPLAIRGQAFGALAP
ncbi:MAG: hypothetical protein ABIL09_15780, partial [Gemmatimonadota bacterium]